MQAPVYGPTGSHTHTRTPASTLTHEGAHTPSRAPSCVMGRVGSVRRPSQPRSVIGFPGPTLHPLHPLHLFNDFKGLRAASKSQPYTNPTPLQ